MKGRELIRKLRRNGVDIIRGRGKGGHVLASYKGRQTTIPVHGDIDIAPPFVKAICKQLGIDPQDLN
jgi:mRNA interferase HicA